MSPAEPVRRDGAVAPGRPAPVRPARPPLRVVDEHARRRRAFWRRLGLLGGLVAFVGVLAAVSLHVFVVQSQFQLEDLQSQVADAQARVERNRLAVAELSSPARIVEAASLLGMVEPDQVTYLTTDPAVPDPLAAGAPGAVDPAASPPADAAVTADPAPPAGVVPSVIADLAARWAALKEDLVPGP